MLTTCAAVYALQSASQAADILKTDRELSDEWKKTAADLLRHLPNDGEKYIAYANADEMSVGSIGGTVPYDVLARSDKLARNTIYDFEKNGLHVGNMYNVGTRICSWYAAWLSCAMARIGDGEGAKRNIERATDSIGRFAEIFEINEPSVMSVPWCSSPQGTYIQAVNEMFLQCRGDTISILPAVPKDWKNYTFKLRAFDNIVVEGKCVDGKPEINLTALKNHSGREKTVIISNGIPKKITLAAGGVERF